MDFVNRELGDYLDESLTSKEDWKALAMDLIGQMEESSYLFHQILSSTPHSMLLISPTGKIMAASQLMLKKFLDTTKEKLIGKSFLDVNFPIFYNCGQDMFIKKIISEALKEKLDYENFMRESIDKEQKDIYVEMSVKVLRNRNDTTSGLLVTFSEQMVRLNLVPAMQEKEQILKRMGSLSAGVVHEVKNPIQSISGIVQLLQMQYSQDDNLLKKLEVIMAEISGVNVLLTEFLSFSRKEKMEVCYCNINDICREVLCLLHGACYLDEIQLVENFSPTMPQMVIDHNRIKQVIVNFVANAMDAIKELKNSETFNQQTAKDYQGTISIRTYYDYGLNECHVEVKDNGIGMNSELIKKITQPFFSTKKYGTGMGVAISNNIIMDYGGSLKIFSSPGKGSKFDVVLPELAGLMSLMAESGSNSSGQATKVKSVEPRIIGSLEVLPHIDIIKDGFSCLEQFVAGRGID